MNGLLLAGTTVFLRGTGLIFNVYITQKIGAEGMGLFGLIMSVYMLATTVASSGGGLAATRLVTEEQARGRYGGTQKAMHVCMLYCLFFGVVASFCLFIFAPQIGQYWLSDERTIGSLRCLSVSLPFISLSGAMNGYFMAVRRVIKSASAQIFELLVKILATVLTLRFFGHRGIEFACMAVVCGGSVAEIASFCYLFVLYRWEQRTPCDALGSRTPFVRRLLGFAIPIAISSYFRSGLVTLEHVLVPAGLKRYGADRAASLSQYGIVHGMVMPLLLFPASVLGAFAGLLVPEMTEFQTKGHADRIRRVASKVIQTSLLFSVGISGVFLIFGHELGQGIYKSGDAGLFICFLAPLTVVMYLDGVVDAMLKGLNQQVYSMRYNILDSAVSVALVYTVLPRYGVNGYIAIIFITEILNALLSIRRLRRVTDFQLSFVRGFVLPCCAIGLACVVTKGIFNGAALSAQGLYGAIFCCAVLYLLFLGALGLYRQTEKKEL